MQMKDLSIYIKESIDHSNDELIEEGLFSWLKKFWNWLFSDNEKNIKANNGRYTNSEDVISQFSSSKSSNKTDFNFGYLKADGDKGFKKLISAETSDSPNFVVAKNFFEKNSNLEIFSLVAKKECIGFIFCKKDKKELEIVKIIFSQDIISKSKNIEKSDILKKMLSEFDKWINKEYKGKISIKRPVDPKTVDKTIYKEKQNKKYDSENQDNDNNEDDEKSDKSEKASSFETKAKSTIKKKGQYDRFMKLLKGDGIKSDWKDNDKGLDYSKVEFEFNIVNDYKIDDLIEKLKDLKPIYNWKTLKDNKILIRKDYKHPIIVIKSKSTNEVLGCVLTDQNVDKNGKTNTVSKRMFFMEFVWNKSYIKQNLEKIDNKEFASVLLYHLFTFIQNEKMVLENKEYLSLTEFIKEAQIDTDNLFWKIDTFFQKDNFQKSLFNALFIDGEVDKAISDGFDLKSFVNFIMDDVNPSLDKDYKYQMTKILNLLRSKNYKINDPKL